MYLNTDEKLYIAMNTYGTETLDVETERSGVQGQPGIDSETPYPKSKTQAMKKAAGVGKDRVVDT